MSVLAGFDSLASIPRIARMGTMNATPLNRFATQAMLRAIRVNDCPKVREALIQGADPNYRTKGGVTPLMLAAGKHEIVCTLLVAGGNITAMDDRGRAFDDYAMGKVGKVNEVLSLRQLAAMLADAHAQALGLTTTRTGKTRL